MMLKTKKLLLLAIILQVVAFMFSCNGGTSGSSNEVVVSKKAGMNDVFVHLNSDLDKINPIISTSANASLVERFVFFNLLERSPSSLEMVPVLAVSRPDIEQVKVDVFGEEKDGLSITYEIRPEATWDDGTPITADDYIFTIKAIKNPKVDCEHARPYFEFIIDIVKDETNPKKFTIFTKDTYILSESSSSSPIIPKHLYDPIGLMDGFTIREMSDPANSSNLSDNLDLIKFAEQFNAEEYSRNPELVNGAGPYKLNSWSTGQRIILEKKENWWGDQFVGELERFDNYPDKIIYEIIVDNTTAITAMKDESVDVMRNIPSKHYVKLQENEGFKQLYNLHEPIAPQYSYIGLNTKSPKLADKAVRQALAHAVDYDNILKILYYNLAQRTIGPVHPNKNFYNHNIEPYAFDLNLSKKLLDDSGWIDSDGNGVRDKMMEGSKVELNLEFLIPSGSELGQNVALMLKDNMTKLGVNIEIVTKEWTVYLEETKAHNFEMSTAAWVMPAGLSDFKQIWHTDSYNGGSNYVGFGNAYTDELIDKIRYEMDEAKRLEMYLEFQEILHEEVPYIFTFTPMNKMAFHKRFDNAKPYLMRPGFFETEFKLNPNFGAASAQ